MENTITLISTYIGVATWLIYWTGRWYKEWYFNQFNIPHEVLGFDHRYYLFGSWLTILVALSGFIIVINFLLFISLRCGWLYILLSFIPILFSILVIFINPIRFFPNKSFIYKVLSSKDLLIVCLGILAFILTFALKIKYSKEFNLLMSSVTTFFHNNLSISIIAIFISSWIYLGIIGHFVGVYHGQSAINFGKMGIKYVMTDTNWWMLVVRSSDERNFLYDKKTKTTIVVNDDAIKFFSDSIPKSKQQHL